MSFVIENLPAIKHVEFLNSTLMFVHLANERVFLVSLDEFPAIKSLSAEQRKDYEVIDSTHLSFLALDDVYSLEELIGLNQ